MDIFNMRLTTYILLLIGTLAFVPDILIAQSFTIGDKVPDIKASHVINSDNSELSFSDYKGKMIILDFWGTGCTACIKAFPKIDSLQEEFKDKIQIIAINQESKDSTLKFLQKHKRIKLPKIPFITQDTLISKLFPHKFVPHHVWIDSSNRVRFITNDNNTSKENLARYFENQLAQLKSKKDVIDFDNSKLIVAEGNGRWANKAIYYSSLLHGLPGLQAGGGLIKPNHFRRNGSIVDLLKIAFTNNGDEELIDLNFESPLAIDLQVKDKFQYVIPADLQKREYWWENYGYFYEVMVPMERSKDIFKFMQQELMRYFNLDVSVKKRKMKCLALVKLDPKKKIKNNVNSFNDSVEYNRYNIPLKLFPSYLTRELNWNRSSYFPPIINYTGTTEDSLDIKISTEAIEKRATLDQLRKELRKCNLDLVERECLTNVLVIKEME
ncbi:TlpA family protein disulfide reductase [Longitalea luteola]|uniref:TlpA family protein disulfide reductase n=1 Tax=Longitalea luteola TaxID=2812563 RepID=UPI001A972278|nr:TlpA disulfide reductase family protein [Longitalea luteola]